MKNLLLLAMLASTPAAAQEFSSDIPAVSDILVKTRAFQASASASLKAAAMEAAHQDGRVELLNDIEKMKAKIQKYGDDPTRAGIYKAELSLLYLKLAFEDASGIGAPAAPSETPAVDSERAERQARLPKDRMTLLKTAQAFQRAAPGGLPSLKDVSDARAALADIRAMPGLTIDEQRIFDGAYDQMVDIEDELVLKELALSARRASRYWTPAVSR